MSPRFTPNTFLLMLVILFIFMLFLGSLISHASEREAGADQPVPQRVVQEDADNAIERAADIMNACLSKEAQSILLDIIYYDQPDKDKAFFMLGRLYKEEGDLDKAEEYLKKTVDAYPLLRDYALKALTDVYMDTERFDEAIETSRLIQNNLLSQYAKQSEITSLLSLDREDKAVDAFFQYIETYPDDWDNKFRLATILKNRGDVARAVSLYKDIYIHAVPLWKDAFRELKLLKADVFSQHEVLQRADHLFAMNDFQNAEAAYQEVLGHLSGAEKIRVMFLIGMCQFKQKKYDESAGSFDLLGSAKSMYWQARSYYRVNNREGFDRTKKEFEKKYPADHRRALLLLMEADEFRRKGAFELAEKSYRMVLDTFPGSEEDALWGLGWMNYVAGNYQRAYSFFSRLAQHVKSRDYYKYLYWETRSQEKLTEDCIKRSADAGRERSERNHDGCNNKGENFYRELPSDESFYGYLIKFRSSADAMPDKIEIAKPVKPEGPEYDRIEALTFLGLSDEAVAEIVQTLQGIKKREEFFYIAYLALKLDEYKEIIYYAEPREEREYLPYSYPLGYWSTIQRAAGDRNLDEHLIAAVIREESRFDPTVISWAGAIGLMQLMPATANRLKEDLKISLSDDSQLQDAKKNIFLGSYYLSQLILEFEQIPLAIAAYNAGNSAVKRWMETFDKEDTVAFIENIPYKETRRYVKKVLKSYWQYKTINGLPILFRY